jgi:hypothetical protein
MSLHFTILLSVLVTFSTGTFGPRTQDRLQKSPSNPPTHYETAGPYQILWHDSSRSVGKETLTQIRGFLWEHYDGKVPGKLEVTFYTLEGEPTHYQFLVDAMPRGEWGIRSTITMFRGDYSRPKKKPTKTVVEEKYCYVGRIDPSSEKAIPIEEKRSAESYRLVLKICKDRGIASTW